MGRRWGFLGRLVSLGERKELPNGEKVRSSGMGISPRKLREPLSGDKVVSLGRIVSLPRGDTTTRDNDIPQDWMQHPEERRMGVPRQYRGCLSRQGRGMGHGEWLVSASWMRQSQGGWSSRQEVWGRAEKKEWG
jgi:hypothetical protein